METTATTAIVETTATSDAYTTTIVTTDAQPTTDIIATTTTSEDESTTTAAEPMATFNIVGGGGDVNGDVLEGRDDGTTELMFNPPYQGFRQRAYAIDPSTGRVQDQGTGKYLCAYYAITGSATPATVPVCVGNPNLDQGSAYLNCMVLRGRLSCQVPEVVCSRNLMDPFAGNTCETSPGREIYDEIFLLMDGDRVITLGRGRPNNYQPIFLTARGV